MKKIILSALTLITVSQASAFGLSSIKEWWRDLTWGPYLDYTSPGQCEKHYPLGYPQPYQKYKRYHLCRSGFASQYSPDTKNSEVVMYTVKKENFSGFMTNLAGNDWMSDPQLEQEERASPANYFESGYFPMPLLNGLEVKNDQTAADETYFSSNTIPGIQKFTHGIWATLLRTEEKWVGEKGELIVATGPLFVKKPIKTIGKQNVLVPSHIYKIFVDPSLKESITFIFPIEAIMPIQGNIGQNAKYDFSAYVYNIETVEKILGSELFPKIKNMNYSPNFKKGTTGQWGLTRKDPISSSKVITKK